MALMKFINSMIPGGQIQPTQPKLPAFQQGGTTFKGNNPFLQNLNEEIGVNKPFNEPRIYGMWKGEPVMVGTNLFILG